MESGDAVTSTTPAAKRPPAPLPLRFLIPLVVVVVLSVSSAAGFNGALLGWSFLSASVLGALGSASVVTAARRYRLLLGESVALSVLAFFVLGPIAAQGLPTIGAASSFLDGLVNGWADLLSSVPPADATPTLRVLPYSVAWLSALIGGELVRRDNLPVAPVLGPTLGLVITSLITVENRPVAAVVGVAIGIGAVLLGVSHQWLAGPMGSMESDRASDLSHSTPSITGRSRPRSMAWSAGLLGAIAVVSPVVGPRLPLAAANDRFDLRQYQERPWDPLDVPSPLVTIKASLKEEQRDEVVFVVRADEPLTRFSTAILGSYDGVVWAVADSTPGAPAEFVPVDRFFPMPSEAAVDDAVGYEIEIVQLDGPWLPIAGTPVQVGAGDEPRDLRFSRATGTVASPSGLSQGDVLSLISIPVHPLTDAERRDVTVISNDEDADLALVPPQMRNLAGDVFEGIDVGVPRAEQLANRFVSEGFYDQSENARPGHSLARLDEFTSDPERLVGFAEQYAATAAVLARIGGLPSRVVVGYQVSPDRWSDGQVSVLADDIDAWIEIETEEFGWVPFDVTPDRAREPEQEQLGVTIKDVAIPNPPPPPPPPPDLRPPSTPEAEEQENEEDDEEDEQEQSALIGTGWRGVAAVAGGALLIPAMLLASLGACVVGWKRRRARKRRAADDAAESVAGAWLELVDRFEEAGVSALDASTPSESAHAFVRDEPAAADAGSTLLALAERVDRAAFHPLPPNQDDAQSAWADCDLAVEQLISTRTRRERMWMRTDPRPLLKRDPTGRRRPRELEEAR